jgi:hypothetical protein
MAQVALNWCIQHNVIPLVGCRSPSQARDSVGCLGWSLSKQDVKKLDQVALDKSTLESKSILGVRKKSLSACIFTYIIFFLSLFTGPPWRRMIFVTLFGIVMVVCRTLDSLGFGSVVPMKKAQ